MDNTQMPNIFTYATHELSQDAFICYWLEFAKKEYEDYPLFKLAQNLLQKIGVVNEYVLCNPERQQKKMDALVKTTNHYIIIEDKISSYEHDNQILRYVEELQTEIKNGAREKKEIICVYFKTGFLSRQEKRNMEELREKIKVNLKIIGLEDLLGQDIGLRSMDVSDFQLFQMFKEKLRSEEDKIKKSEDVQSFEKAEDKGIFFDCLTEEIRKKTNFKDAYWFITGPQHTAHISLFYIESEDIEKYKIYYEMFIMFRKYSFQFVIKEGVYKITDKDKKERILIKNYQDLPEVIKKIRKSYKECINSLANDDFKSVDNDKLMLLKKEFNTDDAGSTKDIIVDKINENSKYLKEIQEKLLTIK